MKKLNNSGWGLLVFLFLLMLIMILVFITSARIEAF